MRELKFRAWSIGNQRWVYFGIDEVPTWVHSAEVEQYTGLKDKHGREIYEGDLLKTDLSRPYVEVVFRNGAFMYQCQDNGKDYYDLMASVYDDVETEKYMEVISNVYEKTKEE